MLVHGISHCFGLVPIARDRTGIFIQGGVFRISRPQPIEAPMSERRETLRSADTGAQGIKRIHALSPVDGASRVYVKLCPWPVLAFLGIFYTYRLLTLVGYRGRRNVVPSAENPELSKVRFFFFF